MKRIAITFLILLIASNSFSQGFINLSKTKVRKQLKEYGAKEKLKTIINETDSTLTLLVRDSSKRQIDIIIHFDNEGICDKQTTSSFCDSCITKYVTPILDNKKYKWHKINSVKYISSYSKKLLLEMDNPFTPNSYSVSRFNLTRRAFKVKLAENKQ